MKAVRLGKVVVALAVIAVAAPAMAEMVSVQANLVDGVSDSNFDGTALTIAQGPKTGGVTTNATAGGTYPLGGDAPYTNVNFSLATNFSQMTFVDGTPWAKFTGGNLSLTFDLGASSYALSGPISVFLARVTSSSSSFSQITAEGLFSAATANMPELWNAPGLSSIDSLVFVIGEDLGSFNWDGGTWGANAQANIQMVPNDGAIPEPASIALLAIGGLALLRRRD